MKKKFSQEHRLLALSGTEPTGVCRQLYASRKAHVAGSARHVIENSTQEFRIYYTYRLLLQYLSILRYSKVNKSLYMLYFTFFSFFVRDQPVSVLPKKRQRKKKVPALRPLPSVHPLLPLPKKGTSSSPFFTASST
jgi:hypothetical protein